MKKFYLIMANPSLDSFNNKLADVYEKALIEKKYEVKRINLIDLKFDINLKKDSILEPDLIKVQEDIKWADEIVFFYPLWWGNMPAILKGFIDRVFLSGFAFKRRPNSPFWDKLLSGKTARVFSTCDAPSFFISLIYKNSDFLSLKKAVFWYTGIKSKKMTRIDKLYSKSPVVYIF